VAREVEAWRVQQTDVVRITRELYLPAFKHDTDPTRGRGRDRQIDYMQYQPPGPHPPIVQRRYRYFYTEISRSQRARAFELRASTSLARLWRDHGKVQQARELLAPVYGWFTEGFDMGLGSVSRGSRIQIGRQL
jgi:hypothetical protein